MDELQSSFKREFDVYTVLKKEMDKQYRELSPEIQYFLSGNAINEYPEIFNVIQERQNQTDETILLIKDKLQIPLFSFLISQIHMTINRQYSSKQRIYELLIYDHLYKYYKMREYKY